MYSGCSEVEEKQGEWECSPCQRGRLCSVMAAAQMLLKMPVVLRQRRTCWRGICAVVRHGWLGQCGTSSGSPYPIPSSSYPSASTLPAFPPAAAVPASGKKNQFAVADGRLLLSVFFAFHSCCPLLPQLQFSIICFPCTWEPFSFYSVRAEQR